MKINGASNDQSISSSEEMAKKNLEGVKEILAGTINGFLKQATEDSKKKTKKLLLMAEEEFEKLGDETEAENESERDDE